MEAVGESSRKHGVNLADKKEQEEWAWLSSRIDKHDDPLLDLSVDPEPLTEGSRFLLVSPSNSFNSTHGKLLDRTESPPTVKSETLSSEINLTTAGTKRLATAAPSSSLAGQRVKQTDDRSALQNTDRAYSVTVSSDNCDFFGSADPTILSTRFGLSYNTPTWPRQMEVKTRSSSYPAVRGFCDPSSNAPVVTSTTTSHSHSQSHRTACGNGALRGELPDVALRQPQSLAHRSEPTSAATIKSVAPASCGSAAKGIIIDCTHDATTGQYGLLPNVPQNRTRFSSNVMLNSFPPPSHGPEVVVSGSYGSVADEVHCHSSISRRMMSDKLAQRQLLTVLLLCVLFMIGETVGGVLANSLALFTDVLHLASDLISYGISLLALYLARKRATRQMTFGYHRAEVLGALFSVFIIWLVSGVLCYIAVERIIHEHYKDVKPNEMLITASLGVVFNLVMGFVLHSEKCCRMAKGHAKFGHGHSHGHSHGADDNAHYDYEPLDVSPLQCAHEENHGDDEEDPPPVHRHKNINVRAAFIHVVGDIIQSLGVLVAALIIKFKENEQYRLADPICTFIFSLLVLCTTVNVLKDTLRIIMEGVPQGVDYEQLRGTLLAIDSVVAVHNLHVWALTMDRNALSVHLAVDNSRSSVDVLKDASRALKRHDLSHVTIQVESYNHDVMSVCSDCQLPPK